MKTTQDSIARQIPWDLAFASGIPMFLFIAVVGGLFSLPAVLLGYMISVACITAISGAGLMTWAKIPQYRAGHFFRLGCGGVDCSHRRAYWIGLGVSFASIVVAAVLLGLLWLKG